MQRRSYRKADATATLGFIEMEAQFPVACGMLVVVFLLGANQIAVWMPYKLLQIIPINI